MSIMADINLPSLITAIAAAGLFLAIWFIGMIFWIARSQKKSQQLRARMGMEKDSQERELNLWIDGKRISTRVAGQKRVYTLIERLLRLYQETGWTTPIGMFAVQIGLLTLLAFLAALFFNGNIVVASIAAATVPWLTWIMAQRQVDKRKELFDRQFIDALELGGRSLRAGHPLGAAVQIIAQEVPVPVGELFADVCRQQDLGVGLSEAIKNISDNSEQENLKMLAATIAIHYKSGGSLADMLERLAFVIRDRVRLDQRVDVLTAQMHFNKRVLLLLPVVMFVLLNIINPHYMQPLYYTTTGHLMLLICAIGLFLGGWMMNKLAKIEY